MVLPSPPLFCAGVGSNSSENDGAGAACWIEPVVSLEVLGSLLLAIVETVKRNQSQSD